MIIDSADLAGYSAYDLLRAAAKGYIGIDQRLLHALIDRPEETLPDIVRFSAENRDASQERISLDGDLVSIFHHLRAPGGLPFLIKLIREDPTDIADDLVEAFVAIGKPAIEPLLELHSELGDENGAEVSFLLAGMGVKDARILELLMRRLDVDWSDGLFHLEVYGDPETIPLLESRLEGIADDDELWLDLRDTIRELQEPKSPGQITGFNIWDLYPESDTPAFDLLSEEERLEFLDSPNEQLRADALLSFFGHPFSLQTRAKLLETARQDASPVVRAAAWRNFFDLVEEEPELRNTLLERLGDLAIDQLERAGLAIALAQHSDRSIVRTAILDCVENPVTRSRGLEAAWRSFDESFQRLPAQYINDTDTEVRRNAIWGIGYLKVTQDAGLLRKFFDNEMLRPDALHNYAIAAPGATNRKKVLDLYDKIAELAHGFADGEEEIVKAGLDVRLMNAGLPPIFESGEAENEPEFDTAPATSTKVGRNDLCPCGSGKKYKKCCGHSLR